MMIVMFLASFHLATKTETKTKTIMMMMAAAFRLNKDCLCKQHTSPDYAARQTF